MFGAYKATNLEGIELTQNALSSQIGPWASSFLAIIIFLFAFSSLLGNYYYGETNIEFIKQSKTWLTIYRIAVVGMVLFGSVATLQVVWNMADLFMGLMVITNLIAITLLGRFAYGINRLCKAKETRERSSLQCRFYSWFNEYRVLG